MQENPVIAQSNPALSPENHLAGMDFDTTGTLGSLRKFQNPARFEKARFYLKLYTNNPQYK